MIENRGEVDGRRVTADADGVERARRRRGGKNHEAQRERRKAPDQTQSRFSPINATRPLDWSGVAAINDMNVREIKGFPDGSRARGVTPSTQFCQYVRCSPCAGAHQRPFPAGMCCPSRVLYG